MYNIKLRNWIPGQARNDIRLGIVFLALIAFMCVASLSNAVTVPQMINYSGTLNDINANPVANGNYSMEFSLYDVASGGAALWTEKWDTTTSQVPVVNGTFNVMLGAIDKVNNPIPASFFAQYPTTYLGIKVGNDSEMLPRQMITSVGYALSAWNGVPKGGIIMWSGEIDANGNPKINGSPDTSWHICDGTNSTPDLRDRFIVGAGNGGSAYSINNKSQTLNYTLNFSHSHVINDHTHGINATDTNHAHTIGSDGNHAHNYSGATSQAIDADLKRRGQSDPQEVTRGFHTHNYSGTTDWQGTHSHGGGTGTMNQTHSHSMGGASDRGTDSRLSEAQDIRPPYYALAFIMKL